jgi:hypothetical protein
MTIKTHAELTALLADNTTGDISPQDIRDFLDSVMGVYGAIFVSAGSTGQTIASGVAEQVTEFTHDGAASGVTPAYGSNQITIDNAGIYAVNFNMSFAGITNCTFQFTMYKHGSPMSPVLGAQRKTGNTDIGSCGFNCQVTLVATDVLSIWVEGDQNGAFTAQDCQFTVQRIA